MRPATCTPGDETNSFIDTDGVVTSCAVCFDVFSLRKKSRGIMIYENGDRTRHIDKSSFTALPYLRLEIIPGCELISYMVGTSFSARSS